MTTQRNGSTQRKSEIVKFEPNVPLEVALAYSEGKMKQTNFGERWMFSLTDGRVMFLDPPEAATIAELGINVRERFTICLHEENGQESWEIARAHGQQPNGTFTVPASAPPAVPERKQPTTALVEEANRLVDAYAEVLGRALTTYEGRIKPDEVRSILLSAYIQRGKSAA